MRANQPEAPVRQYIGGEWIDGECGTGECINPASGERDGTFTGASIRQTELAIAAARDAFERTSWARSPRLRSEVLLAFADNLEQARNIVELSLVRFNGKLAREAANEVGAAISALRYYAGLSRNLFGRVNEFSPGGWSMIAREAAGVAAIIVPWNAPVSLMIRSLAPAMAAGCAAVIKHAPQTSPAASAVIDCLARVENMPSGVVNGIVEFDSESSQLLCASPDVDVVSFTGSSATGKRIAAVSAATMKHLSLELGGKAPAIVFGDCDLNPTIAGIRAAATVMCGQMCTAITRVLVEDRVFKAFSGRLAESLAEIAVGPGIEPASDMGPLINLANRERVARIAESAAGQGYVHLNGVVPGGRLASGAFITPTLVEIDALDSPLIQEEVFGPVIVLERFASEDEAIIRANATRYGLSASVWSGDLKRAIRIASQVRAGTVWINCHNRHAAETETGGYRESGLGRLYGIEALNEFLQTKHVYFDTDSPMAG